MAYSTPVGTAFYISQTFAATKTVTIASNADPCLATAASHGYSDNDEVLFLSGWERANNGVFKVDQQSTDTFLIKGLNSTSTTLYAAGSGTGTTSKISSWLELPKILAIDVQGGDPKYAEVNPLKLLQGLLLPDGFNPARLVFTIGWDPTETNWASMLDISRNNTLVAYKAVKGTQATYGYGYFSMAEQPRQQRGQADSVQATFAAQGPMISYAS